MKKNIRRALILTTNKKLESATRRIVSILIKKGYKNLMTEEKYFFFIVCNKNYPDGLSQIQIKDYFKNYIEFDDFLLTLVDNGFNSMRDFGIVLGHFDNEGFFWTDYSRKKYNFEEIKNVDEVGGEKSPPLK